MRPPEFTGGNLGVPVDDRRHAARFNEAAGIHRRKQLIHLIGILFMQSGFNEAAGIHRRKHAVELRQVAVDVNASMRPPEFTGGNYIVLNFIIKT